MATKKINTNEECPFKDIVIPKEEVHEMDTRVGKLEGIVEALTRNIQEVSNNINTVGTQLNDLKDTLSKSLIDLREGFTQQLNLVTDRLTTSVKPQWQTITAFISIAIVLLGMTGAVVGLILSGQGDRIGSLQNDTNTITQRMFDNQYEKGKNDSTTTKIIDSLNALDTKLQKEIILTNGITDAKINGLDTKLQIEFNLIRKNLETSIENNLVDIKNIKDWRLRHAEEDSALGAKLLAKQEMIEKKLETVENRQYLITEKISQLDYFRPGAGNTSVQLKPIPK